MKAPSMVETLLLSFPEPHSSSEAMALRVLPVRSPNGGLQRPQQGYSYKLTENTITCEEAVFKMVCGDISKCNY